jgi:hypothetical protein
MEADCLVTGLGLKWDETFTFHNSFVETVHIIVLGLDLIIHLFHVMLEPRKNRQLVQEPPPRMKISPFS